MLPYPSRKKKSKKLFLLSTVVAACIFTGSYFSLTNSSGDEVVAKINGQKIFKSEVQLRLSDVFEGQGSLGNTPELDKLPKEVVEILVKEVYLERELTKEALKSEATKTKEVKEKIADAKNKILRQAYIDSILKEEVTDKKINDKYLDLSKELEGKREYQIFHIVVKTKEEADKISAELNSKKGATKFAELAKKYSIDQDSAAKGGEIDYTLEDNMIKEIAAIVKTLQKGEISNPVETKFGWHLIKVGDIREAQALSFESVKDNIRDQLIQDRVNELNNKIIKNAKVQLLINLKEVKKTEAAPVEQKIAAPEEATTEQTTAVEATSESAATEEKAAESAETKTKSNEELKKNKKSKR